MVVKWHEEAMAEMEHIANYIEITFNINHAQKFIGEVYHFTNLLANSPRMGKPEPLIIGIPGIDVRSIVVNKLCKLVYIIDGTTEETEELYILALWDTRRNPDNLTDEMRKRM